MIVRQLGEKCESLRLGLVSFRDYGFNVETAAVSVPLSDQIEDQLRIMKGWTTGSGGTTREEDQYLGIRQALDLWRPDSESKQRHRVVVIVTDVGAKQTDVAGNTFDSITQAANELKVPLFSIIVRNADFPDDYEQGRQHAQRLARATRARMFTVEDAPDVADVLMDSIQTAIEIADPWMWHAPMECVETLRVARGETVDLSLRRTGAGTPLNLPDVVLRGTEADLVLKFAAVPSGTWSRFRFRLDESTPWKKRGSNADVTREDFDRVLTSLESFQLRGEFVVGPDAGGIDRIIISSTH